MAKGLLVTFALLFALVVFAATFSGKGDPTKPAPVSKSSNTVETPRSPDPIEGAHPVSAFRLFVDYQRNEVAADNTYKDRRLAVTGQVAHISKDFSGDILIGFATLNEFMDVEARMSKDNAPQAARLLPGNILTVVCDGAGMIVGSPTLENCSFVSPQQIEKLRSELAAQQAKPQPTDANISTNEPPPNLDEAKPSESAQPEQAPAGAAPIERRPPTIGPPSWLHQAEPEYTDQARAAKLNGNVLLSLVVDQQGRPTNIHVIRSLGMGLDEKAVEALEKSTFHPALQNGTPVPYPLQIEMNFRMF